MSLSSRYVIRFTIALFALGLLALIAIVGTTIWLGENAQRYANEAAGARDTRISAVELRSAMQTAESSQRGFLVSGNEVYLAPLSSAKAMVQTQFERLKQELLYSAKGIRMMQRLSDVISEKFEEIDKIIALKNDFRDTEALAIFKSNRGKALMDEANVYLTSVIRATDDRLTMGIVAQRRNATLLRWVSIVGGLIIIGVVGAATITIYHYARDIILARDEVNILNTTLEQRVEDRTADLVTARDKAQLLLAEVNHRVANSLSIVASLVRLQSNAVTDRTAKDALKGNASPDRSGRFSSSTVIQF